MLLTIVSSFWMTNIQEFWALSFVVQSVCILIRQRPKTTNFSGRRIASNEGVAAPCARCSAGVCTSRWASIVCAHTHIPTHPHTCTYQLHNTCTCISGDRTSWTPASCTWDRLCENADRELLLLWAMWLVQTQGRTCCSAVYCVVL